MAKTAAQELEESQGQYIAEKSRLLRQNNALKVWTSDTNT